MGNEKVQDVPDEARALAFVWECKTTPFGAETKQEKEREGCVSAPLGDEAGDREKEREGCVSAPLGDEAVEREKVMR